MVESSPAERALLGIYLDAEGALLRVATSHFRSFVDSDEPRRRIDGAQALARATARIVGYLDGAVPGLLGEILAAAADRGQRAAVAQLDLLTRPPGSDAYADRDVARGPLDRLAATLIGRAVAAHSSMLRTVPDAYRAALARVLPASLVGVETRRQTAQQAWWNLARQGLTRFTDDAGRAWRLSSYVEMATRTATARAQIDAQHDRLAGAGQRLVIVQGSGDRCERCRPWHGKILSTDGSGASTVRVEHALRDGVYLDIDVAGSIGDARASGWNHPQCRCSTALYQAGVTRPTVLPRDDPAAYEARQRQRAIERQIRAAKEREQAALDPAAARTARAQTATAQARMRAHLGDNPDLLRRSYRETPGAGNVPVSAPAR